MDDRVIGACIFTAPAVDAFVVIDDGAVFPDGNGVLGADIGAGVCETTTTLIRDDVFLVRTRLTRKRDDGDERRFKMRLLEIFFIESVGDETIFRVFTAGETETQTQTFLEDGALFKNRVAIGRHFARKNAIRRLLEFIEFYILKGDPCNFRKNLSANIDEIDVGFFHSLLSSPP